jgi:hypothetical protein
MRRRFCLPIMFVVPLGSFVEWASPLSQLRFSRFSAEPIGRRAVVPTLHERAGTAELGLAGAGTASGRSKAMKIKQKLQNPFALIAEGFVAGAIMLYATTPANVDRPAQDVPMEAVTAGAAAQSSQA